MQNPPARRRPVLSTTVASDSLNILKQVAQDTGLPNVGVAIDYIINDWKRKRAAAEAVTPTVEALS